MAGSINNCSWGAGTITVATADVGFTVEDIAFRVEIKSVQLEANGARGPIVQGEAIQQMIPFLEFTLAEHDLTRLQYALAGSTLTSDASSEILSGSAGYVASAAYKTVVFTSTRPNAKTDVVTITNAIMLDNLEVKHSDKGWAGYKVTMRGSYAAASPTVPPFSILHNIA